MNYYDNLSTDDRQQMINTRLYERNKPDHPLQPYFSFYPKHTKYTTQAIIDESYPAPTKNYKVYDVSQFNPGTHAPWHGYASSVNVESELRNQIYPLNCSGNNHYIPPSTSNMYTYSYNSKNNNSARHSILDVKSTYETTPNNESANKYFAKSTFNNHTRNQLKNVYDN